MVQLTVLTPRLLARQTVKSWEESLTRTLSQAGEKYAVRLTLRNQLGTTLTSH